MFPDFTLFSSLFYRFLIRNWGFSRQVLSEPTLETAVQQARKRFSMPFANFFYFTLYLKNLNTNYTSKTNLLGSSI
ncbi:MAG: hypothetical protein ACR5LA_11220 [Wolbachia sp.]